MSASWLIDTTRKVHQKTSHCAERWSCTFKGIRTFANNFNGHMFRNLVKSLGYSKMVLTARVTKDGPQRNFNFSVYVCLPCGCLGRKEPATNKHADLRTDSWMPFLRQKLICMAVGWTSLSSLILLYLVNPGGERIPKEQGATPATPYTSSFATLP